MLEVPVFKLSGEQSGTMSVDPEKLGGEVRYALLKQAIVHGQANLRQNTSANRSRGMVVGSTRKLYRQKGSGNARMGAIRTNIRKGGGVAFAKGNQNYKQAMPRKMRRLARNNAVLAKLKGESLVVFEDLTMEAPKTKTLASALKKAGVTGSCLIAIHEPNQNTYLSGRNLDRTDINVLDSISAYQIMRRKRLVMTRQALEGLLSGKTFGDA
jgi:large subunit ribosomal protein L4